LFTDEFIQGISAMHVYSFNMQPDVMKNPIKRVASATPE